jgi:hypothetical protein
MSTLVKIALDEKVKNVSDFQSVQTFNIDKDEIFKYGIFMQEVPGHVKESDFDYLQSKVPAMAELYEDYVQCTDDEVINLSEDDRTKKLISEVVGVALGLKYATTILSINSNKFEKIPPPTTGKYLDYAVTVDGKKYQIETKGTIGKNTTSMQIDIEQKKEDTKNDICYLKFGVISKISSNRQRQNVECLIVDDPPTEDNKDTKQTIEPQLKHYFDLFSFILDSRNYNRCVGYLSKGQINKIRIKHNRFFANYNFNGHVYYGECFDSRLIRDNVERKGISSGRVKKYFIGLDLDIISAINKQNSRFMATYTSERIIENSNNIQRFLDRDGVLIVSALKGTDKQLEQIFTEEEVERRLRQHQSYIDRKPHQCGRPCRSKDKEGKPCEMMTYRSACHFHR